MLPVRSMRFVQALVAAATASGCASTVTPSDAATEAPTDAVEAGGVCLIAPSVCPFAATSGGVCSPGMQCVGHTASGVQASCTCVSNDGGGPCGTFACVYRGGPLLPPDLAV